MPEKVVIIGAGGHGKVIADIVRAAGDEVIGFLDDDSGKKVCYGLPVLGRVSNAIDMPRYKFLIAIGDNLIRKKIAIQMKLPWYTAIHPTAIISPTAKIGEGTVVMPGAIINAEAMIGKHCIINTGAVVEHENCLEDYVHLSPKVALGGQVTIGERTHVGIGAVVRNNISICADCVIGAGTTVVKTITIAGIYVGVPSKKII